MRRQKAIPIGVFNTMLVVGLTMFLGCDRVSEEAATQAAPVAEERRTFTVEYRDAQGAVHPVKGTLTAIERNQQQEGLVFSARVETDLDRTFVLKAAMDSSGTQTLWLSDDRGTYHQAVLNDEELLIEYAVGGVPHDRQIRISGASLKEIVRSYPELPGSQEQVTLVEFPLHRLLIAAVEAVDDSRANEPLSLLRKALALQLAAIVPQTTGSEWNTMTATQGSAETIPSWSLPRFATAGSPLVLYGMDAAAFARAPEKERCNVEDTDEAVIGSTNIPIPGIATVDVQGIAASVHAKCFTDDSCLRGESDGNINVTPFAAVPLCDTIFQNGTVHFTAHVGGEGGVKVTKGDCQLAKDDYIRIASIVVTPAGAQPLKAAAVTLDSDAICAASRAVLNVKGCVGQRQANGPVIPLIFTDIRHKSHFLCTDPVLPPAPAGAGGGGTGS